MKVQSTVDEKGPTLWLPIRRWPVVSLSIVDEGNRNLLWSVLHESFREAEPRSDEHIELTMTQVACANGTHNVVSVSEPIPLHYGQAPEGMRQTVPRHRAPASLRHGERYFVVVRENVDDGVRWFEFSIGGK